MRALTCVLLLLLPVCIAFSGCAPLARYPSEYGYMVLELRYVGAISDRELESLRYYGARGWYVAGILGEKTILLQRER